jgi:hypothetical protein
VGKAKLNGYYAKFSTLKCRVNVTPAFTAKVMPSALTESRIQIF